LIKSKVVLQTQGFEVLCEEANAKHEVPFHTGALDIEGRYGMTGSVFQLGREIKNF